MKFKDEFVEIIKNTTVYKLSKITGIERTKLHRIKKGERLPNENELERICEALALTEDVRAKLFNARQIELIGVDRYNSRRLSRQFLADISDIFENVGKSKTDLTLNIKPDFDGEVLVGRNKKNTIEMIKNALYSEIIGESGIKIYSAADDTVLFDIISQLLEVSHGKIEHLISFIPSLGNYELYFNNIESIKKIYSLFLKNKGYDPRYQYSPVSYHSLFPHSIITDRYCIIVSEGIENAIFIKDGDAVDSARELFVKRWEQSSRFLQNVEGLVGYIERSYAEKYIAINENTIVYSLEPEPALAEFLTKDMLLNAINREYKDAEIILGSVFKSLFSQYFKAKKRIVFLEDGIDKFLQTGRMSELPEDICNPFKPSDRKRIMNRLIAAAKEGENIFPMLAKPNKLKFGENIRFFGSEDGSGVFLLFGREKSRTTIMTLNEKGLSAPFCDFMQSLEADDCVYTVEETIKILEEKMKSM